MYLRCKKVLYSKPKVYYSEANNLYYYTFDDVEGLIPGRKMIAIARNKSGKTKSKIYVVEE